MINTKVCRLNEWAKIIIKKNESERDASKRTKKNENVFVVQMKKNASTATTTHTQQSTSASNFFGGNMIYAIVYRASVVLVPGIYLHCRLAVYYLIRQLYLVYAMCAVCIVITFSLVGVIETLPRIAEQRCAETDSQRCRVPCHSPNVSTLSFTLLCAAVVVIVVVVVSVSADVVVVIAKSNCIIRNRETEKRSLSAIYTHIILHSMRQPTSIYIYMHI